ncbi:MAG: hypothetical protein ACFN0Z_04495 [Parascardovia denticolens]
MKPETWHTIAVVFFCLAAVLLLATVLLFFLLKIPAVHDFLTGKTAEKEISRLRHSRYELWRSQETGGSWDSGQASASTPGQGESDRIDIRLSPSSSPFSYAAKPTDSAYSAAPQAQVEARGEDEKSEAQTVIRQVPLSSLNQRRGDESETMIRPQADESQTLIRQRGRHVDPQELSEKDGSEDKSGEEQ